MFTFLVPAYPGCPGKRPLNGRSSSNSHTIHEIQLHLYTEVKQQNSRSFTVTDYMQIITGSYSKTVQQTA